MEIFWKLTARVLSHPKVADWLFTRAVKTPYFHIMSPDGKQIYMARWWLFNPYDNETKKKKYGWCPISVRIHHILRPDDDRDLHDHPWNARTIVLSGWYREERLDGERRRCRGDTAPLRFGEYHRIDEVSEGGVMTLFITGKFRGTWGFLVNGRKVPWRRYLGLG